MVSVWGRKATQGGGSAKPLHPILDLGEVRPAPRLCIRKSDCWKGGCLGRGWFNDNFHWKPREPQKPGKPQDEALKTAPFKDYKFQYFKETARITRWNFWKPVIKTTPFQCSDSAQAQFACQGVHWKSLAAYCNKSLVCVADPPQDWPG